MQMKYYLKQIYYFFTGKSVLQNVFHSAHSKNCLLLYLKEPFLQKEISIIHQNRWQIKEIARIIDSIGYNVDVVNYNDRIVWLSHQYDAVFDICVKDHPVYEKALKPGAKKIVYFTGSESVFANNAELTRIENLYQRRGVRLQPRRQAPLISKKVEEFDEAIIIGNDFNLATYCNFDLPQVFKVPNTGYDLNPIFDRSRKKATSFFYFGSSGCVHKGLDLLLDIFSEPGFPCKLYVCGNVKAETDFCSAYEKELYHTDNIRLIGFINVLGHEFRNIYDECAFTIMPSCSEARAGSVVTCMSAGVIPICSRECGFEEDEVITLEDCTLSTIRDTILRASQKDMGWLEKESGRMIELSKTKYSPEAFSREMKKALQAIL